MPIYSARLAIPSPLSSDPVNGAPADFTAANAVVDAAWGVEWGDALSPGVVGNAVLANSTGPTINSSTGVLTVTLNSDTAWVKVSGVLTRCALPTAGTPLTPSSLPTSGNYRCVGVYVAPPALWSGTGTLSQAVGTSQSSAAAALANPPSTPSGTLLLQYVVVANSSGTYSIASTTDERVRALQVATANVANGAITPPLLGLPSATAYGTGGGDYGTTSGSLAAIDSTNLSVTLTTLAATATPIEVGFTFSYVSNGGGVGTIGFFCDASQLTGCNFRCNAPVSLAVYAQTFVYRVGSGIAAGSHTFRPYFSQQSGTEFYVNNGGTAGEVSPPVFWVKQAC